MIFADNHHACNEYEEKNPDSQKSRNHKTHAKVKGRYRQMTIDK